MKNVLNAKEKNCPCNKKNNSFLLALFSNKKKINYLLDFLFQLLKQFTLIPIAPKTNKGRSESELDFEVKFQNLTCYTFFTPLWPHPSLLSNKHHHGLVLIKLFTKNLHDNFEKIYLRTTLIWCHTM